MIDYSRHTSFVILDTETTGLNPEVDKICSLDAIKIDVFEESDHLYIRHCGHLGFKCDPGMAIPEAASEVNGYLRDPNRPPYEQNLYGLPGFDQYAESIANFCRGSIFVAHNVGFDLAFLIEEMSRVDLNVLQNFIAGIEYSVCTKQSFAEMQGKPRSFEYVQGTSLDKLCDFLHVDRQSREKGHGSYVDTQLATKCLIELIKHHRDMVQPFSVLQYFCDRTLKNTR